MGVDLLLVFFEIRRPWVSRMSDRQVDRLPVANWLWYVEIIIDLLFSWTFKVKVILIIILSNLGFLHCLDPPQLLINNTLNSIILALNDLTLHILLIDFILQILYVHDVLLLPPNGCLLILLIILSLLHFNPIDLFLCVHSKLSLLDRIR